MDKSTVMKNYRFLALMLFACRGELPEGLGS